MSCRTVMTSWFGRPRNQDWSPTHRAAGCVQLQVAVRHQRQCHGCDEGLPDAPRLEAGVGVHQGLFLDVGQTRRRDSDPATRQDEGGHGSGEILPLVDVLQGAAEELGDPPGVHPWGSGGGSGGRRGSRRWRRTVSAAPAEYDEQGEHPRERDPRGSGTGGSQQWDLGRASWRLLPRGSAYGTETTSTRACPPLVAGCPARRAGFNGTSHP